MSNQDKINPNNVHDFNPSEIDDSVPNAATKGTSGKAKRVGTLLCLLSLIVTLVGSLATYCSNTGCSSSESNPGLRSSVSSSSIESDTNTTNVTLARSNDLSSNETAFSTPTRGPIAPTLRPTIKTKSPTLNPSTGSPFHTLPNIEPLATHSPVSDPPQTDRPATMSPSTDPPVPSPPVSYPPTTIDPVSTGYPTNLAASATWTPTPPYDASPTLATDPPDSTDIPTFGYFDLDTTDPPVSPTSETYFEATPSPYVDDDDSNAAVFTPYPTPTTAYYPPYSPTVDDDFSYTLTFHPTEYKWDDVGEGFNYYTSPPAGDDWAPTWGSGFEY